MRLAALVLFPMLIPPCAWCAEWDSRLAAQWLDARQQQWAGWKPARKAGGVCVSCHTNVPYLIARPELRWVLGEPAPTEAETALRDGLRRRLAEPMPATPFQTAYVVESVVAAAVLSPDPAALDRMWATQIREGPEAGAWAWYSLNLDPWEAGGSAFYGATVGARAVSEAPESYRRRAEVAPRVAALVRYLREKQASQPLHHRMGLLWSAAKLRGLMSKHERAGLMRELLGRQQSDGGWTLESLGPWGVHATAPAAEPGSNAYATALAAYTLRKAGVKPRDKGLAAALGWLAARQDRRTGGWRAVSMNQVYPAGSMPEGFMSDAATGFAAAALAGKGR